MARKADGSAKAQRKLTLLALCGALALGLPTAGMALAGKSAPVAAASKRIGELTAQKVQQEGELRRKVWQLLTPEQRAKADAKRAEVRKRRAEEADRLERRARELRGGGTTPR
jgi:ABC-type cobalamin transport system ATPase subunit